MVKHSVTVYVRCNEKEKKRKRNRRRKERRSTVKGDLRNLKSPSIGLLFSKTGIKIVATFSIHSTQIPEKV